MTAPSPLPHALVTLTRVTHAHTAVLADLHDACFTHQPWHRPWDQAAMETILGLPGARGWLALAPSAGDGNPGTPVGLLLLQVAADEADILTLGVLPGAWRRRGIARRLLARGAAALRSAGVTRLLLEVAEANASAVAFYQAEGFAEVGRRHAYFTGEPGLARDALVMARPMETGAAVF